MVVVSVDRVAGVITLSDGPAETLGAVIARKYEEMVSNMRTFVRERLQVRTTAPPSQLERYAFGGKVTLAGPERDLRAKRDGVCDVCCEEARSRPISYEHAVARGPGDLGWDDRTGTSMMSEATEVLPAMLWRLVDYSAWACLGCATKLVRMDEEAGWRREERKVTNAIYARSPMLDRMFPSTEAQMHEVTSWDTSPPGLPSHRSDDLGEGALERGPGLEPDEPADL